MKKLIPYVVAFFILSSCASIPLELKEGDDGLRMIGGKESLLNSIEYPENALKMGIEDVVTVLAYVDTAGVVRDCKVIDGNDYLNDAAIKAMMKQKFHPYKYDGHIRPIRVAIPISFIISDDIDIRQYDAERIMAKAKEYFDEPALTPAQFPSDRSPGDKHDYYSEANTWWPDPDDPNAPYMIKDGEENPDAFIKHMELLTRFSEITSGLTAAYVLNGKKDYAYKAIEHFQAWFMDPETAMNPNFKYAQVIPNRNSERVFGIMDAVPLADVIHSMDVLKKFFSDDQKKAFDVWMEKYAYYLEYDKVMQAVMKREDNYAVAWLLQMASAARYLNDEDKLDRCKNYFSEHLIRFLTEANTPYFSSKSNRQTMYNIFRSTDMLAAITVLLSDPKYNAWDDGTFGVNRAGDLINIIYSGILNYDLIPDPAYHGRYNSLLLAGKAYENPRYLNMWRDLDSAMDIKGGFPIKEPILWLK